MSSKPLSFFSKLRSLIVPQMARGKLVTVHGAPGSLLANTSWYTRICLSDNNPSCAFQCHIHNFNKIGVSHNQLAAFSWTAVCFP